MLISYCIHNAGFRWHACPRADPRPDPLEDAMIESNVAVKDLSLAASLRSAVMNQRIYPSGSPIVERAIAQIERAAESKLKTSDRLTLTDRQGRLFANGQEEPDAAALAGVLREQGVQSLTFVPGV